MATQTRYPTSNYSIGTGADGYVFSYDGWTTGNSCYTCVDEASVDYNDFVSWYWNYGMGGKSWTAEANSAVLFGFSAFSIPAGVTVNSITLYYRTQGYSSNATMGGYGRIRVNGSDYDSSVDHTVDWTNNSKAWTTNPNTSAAWTVDDVNGSGSHPLQYIGYYNDGGTYAYWDGKYTTYYYYNMEVSQLYVVVDYSLAAPTVTTSAVSSIDIHTATGNGNVTADGGATITERGVCWNTTGTPTTANSKATSAGTTGAYTASMTGLVSNTFYYVRAYAINSVGTSYGSQVTFTSLTGLTTYSEGGDSGSLNQEVAAWGGLL